MTDKFNRDSKRNRDDVRAGLLFPLLFDRIQAAYYPHGIPGVVIEVAGMLNDARETLASRGIDNGTLERINALLGDG